MLFLTIKGFARRLHALVLLYALKLIQSENVAQAHFPPENSCSVFLGRIHLARRACFSLPCLFLQARDDWQYMDSLEFSVLPRNSNGERIDTCDAHVKAKLQRGDVSFMSIPGFFAVHQIEAHLHSMIGGSFDPFFSMTVLLS